MSALRILVLTSSTGGGHDARATAFRRWARKLYGWTVDVRVESMLEDSSRIARFGVRFYNFIQRRAPWLHKPYYILVEALSYLNRSRVSLGGKYYREVIESYRPHLVFSVHDCLNRGYFQEARKILGAENVRCATYCSEFSGGFGYSRNWVEPSVDLYISRTQTANDYAVKRLGLDPLRSIVRGQFLMPRVYEETLSPLERHRFITERLGLRSDRRTVLLATGGAGANNHIALLESLKRFGDIYQAVVMCGRNQSSFVRTSHWRDANSQISCHVIGYTNDVHFFMQVSDFVVTRGGTTTCAEALHFGCPIVFNAIGGVMPQESLTVKYFAQDDAAALISSAKEFRFLLSDWYRTPQKFSSLRKRFRKLGFKDEPSDTARLLVDLAREVAGDNESALRVVSG